MNSKLLKIEKLKASLERHKAYQIWWQTKILSKTDTSESAYQSLYAHTTFINECVEKILEIKED